MLHSRLEVGPRKVRGKIQPFIRLPRLDEIETQRVSESHTAPKVYASTTEVILADRAFSSVLKKSKRLADLVALLDTSNVHFCVFGGWLRDTLSGQVLEMSFPRDIDLVAAGIELDQLLAAMPPDTCPTIFGGLHSSKGPIPFDVWPLHDTFLIRKLALPINFESLLQTTDFNINSALYFPAQQTKPSSILDAGMANSLREKMICFNAGHLVYPIVQAARLAAYAAKLNFGFDKNTRAFICDVLIDDERREQEIEGLYKFQLKSVANEAVKVINSILEG